MPAVDEVLDEYARVQVAMKVEVRSLEAQGLGRSIRQPPTGPEGRAQLGVIQVCIRQSVGDFAIVTPAQAGFSTPVEINAEQVDPERGRTSWPNAAFRRA